MKEIEQVVSRYLQEKNTDYAIMITGEWGCGKTYYIQHDLTKRIEETYCQNESSEDVKYSVIYISLYGLSDVDDIRNTIFKKTHRFWGSKGGTVVNAFIGGAADKVGVGRDNVRDLSKLFDSDIINKNVALIFDDLERINYNKISIKEVLGAINQYAEVNKLKVFVISDETKMNDDYNEFKEKTIRYTIKFQRPLSESYDALISNRKNDGYLDFLKKQKDFVINVFQQGKCKNLRTLRFVMDSFQILYDRAVDKKYSAEILKDLLLSMTIYSIEYKNGEKEENLNKLTQLSSYYSYLYRKDDDNEKTKKDYINIVYEKYSNINADYKFIPVINNYIVYGYLDYALFDEYIDTLNNEYAKQEETSEGKLLKKIGQWWYIEDDEFADLIKGVIEAVNNNKYTIQGLTEIYYQFLKFEFYGINNFKLTNTYDRCLRKSAKFVLSQMGYTLYLETMFFKYTPGYYNQDIDQRYESYLKFISDNNKAERFNHDNSIINDFIINLKNGNADKIAELHGGEHAIMIFENLDAKQVSDILAKSDKNVVEAFRIAIYTVYPDRVYRPLSDKERAFIIGLRDEIAEFLKKQKTKKVSSVWYQFLLRKLEDVINHEITNH